MKAVILAGGLGTRLKPFTEVIPKPLLPIGEKAVMEVQIEMLAGYGFDEIYIATNHMSDYVKAFLGNGSKYGVELVFSKEKKRLGTAGPLSLLKSELDEPFIVMNGDILTKLDFSVFYEFALTRRSELTIATKIITTPFRFGNVTVDEDNYVIDVEEKPEFSLEILAGVYCMKPGIFRFIPDNEMFGMDSLIKKMLEAEQKISRYLVREYWIDIGQIEDYSKARKVYTKHFAGEHANGD